MENLKPEIPKTEQSLQSFQLQVNTDYKALGQVLSWFETLKPSSISQMNWFECQTLLAEGFDNVISHAHRNLPTETPINIEVKLLTQALEIRIWDYGPAFDFDQHLRQMPREVDEIAERGRGLLIMLQVADCLSYKRTAERNCFLIIKSYK